MIRRLYLFISVIPSASISRFSDHIVVTHIPWPKVSLAGDIWVSRRFFLDKQTYGSLVIETRHTTLFVSASHLEKSVIAMTDPKYAPWNTVLRSGLFTLRDSFEEGSPLLRSGLFTRRGSFEEGLLYHEADYSRLGAALKRVSFITKRIIHA
jgi:hypothetical protein